MFDYILNISDLPNCIPVSLNILAMAFYRFLSAPSCVSVYIVQIVRINERISFASQTYSLNPLVAKCKSLL
jgi:hypothetical protein